MRTPASSLGKLQKTSVATVATVLKRHGLRSVWMHGPRRLVIGQRRIAGPAFTLRFVPAREDIWTPESVVGPRSARAAIETMPPGCVVVADALGIVTAGVLGDIVCARMQYRRVAGFVTDGAVRDVSSLATLAWPVWSGGAAAPPSTAGFYCADWQVAIGCGGVAVFPDDIIVADDDGVVVVPKDITERVATEAYEMERFEAWVQGQVRQGAPLDGLYPPNEATRKRYEASRSE